MDGLEDKLNAILSDPDAMGRIADMAKSLFSGEGGDKEPSKPEPESDQALIKRVAGLLRGNALRPNEMALLTALRPFLSEERCERLDRAIKLARLASIARIAGEISGLGGDGNEPL